MKGENKMTVTSKTIQTTANDAAIKLTNAIIHLRTQPMTEGTSNAIVMLSERWEFMTNVWMFVYECEKRAEGIE